MYKLLLDELRSRRTAIIGWGLGLAIFAGYVIVLYPDFAEPLQNFNIDDIAIYEAMGGFGDIGSFKGFISAEVFTFLPLLLAVYAIVNGTGTLAGEEDNGTLEPLLALPLPRWQVVLSKASASAIALLLIMVIVGFASAFAFSSLPGDVDTGVVTGSSLMMTALGTWPLLLFFAMLSLFLAALMPSRRHASITATIILVVTFLGNNLAGLVGWLQDLQFLFAFNYYKPSELLTDGWNVENSLFLLAASVVLLVLAIISFQHRNVTVGAWPWQRGRMPTPESN
jgi:ABC-2 type transport system permease protein